jgi:hypothetical protein
MRKIEHELKREFPFATIEVTSGRHYRLKLGNGRSVIVAATPSNHRAIHNLRANVRRQLQAAEDGDRE